MPELPEVETSVKIEEVSEFDVEITTNYPGELNKQDVIF